MASLRIIISISIYCLFITSVVIQPQASGAVIQKSSVEAGAKIQFDRSNDLLLLQYDSKPDPDDIHAIAAAGSILAHANFQVINYFAVSGAYGKQGGKFMHSPELFTLA